MTVRPATEADLDQLVKMGERFAGWAHQPFDADKVRDVLLGAITKPEQVVLVYERSGTIEGGIMGIVYPPWTSNAVLWAVELAWWVDPARRGSAGIRLLQAFEVWAQEHGAVSVSMSAFASLHSTAGPLLTRMGYRPTEHVYMRDLR